VEYPEAFLISVAVYANEQSLVMVADGVCRLCRLVVAWTKLVQTDLASVLASLGCRETFSAHG
jgi:hypothetical protein